MTNRSERRRQDQAKPKPRAKPTPSASTEAYPELTQTELSEAERELRSGATFIESDRATRWASLLDHWMRFDAQRESAMVDYNLRAELPQGTTKQAVENYAQAKRAVLGIENEMIRLFQSVEQEEQEAFLRDRFVFHSAQFSRVVSASEPLRDRLLDRLAKESEAEEPVLEKEPQKPAS